jgi:hypothetical protein
MPPGTGHVKAALDLLPFSAQDAASLSFKKKANINSGRNHAGRESPGRSRGIQQGSAMGAAARSHQ